MPVLRTLKPGSKQKNLIACDFAFIEKSLFLRLWGMMLGDCVPNFAAITQSWVEIWQKL